LDEDESQDDLILDRQNVFAVEDIEVGPDGMTKGRIGVVGH
jgi:hypothetical protein